MCVGFSFEGDVEVSLVEAVVLDKADEPFKKIEEIEREIEEFAHLGGMDGFVIDSDGGAFPFGENNAEEIYGVVSFSYRYEAVLDDFHF